MNPGIHELARVGTSMSATSSRIRTSGPITPPLRMCLRLHGKPTEVEVVRWIREDGISKNDVVLPNGDHVEVSNSDLYTPRGKSRVGRSKP